MNKKFYFIASLLFASAQMGLAQNSIVKRVDVKDIPTSKHLLKPLHKSPNSQVGPTRTMMGTPRT